MKSLNMVFRTLCLIAVLLISLGTSSVTDTSDTEIRSAMRNMSAMYDLSLTDSQIAAISAALMYNN
jgi:hypothetical protein